MTHPRKYVLRKRAEGQAETRRRIIESTIGLHLEVGPAATPITEVARRAGVERATVYKHFPADGDLFAACSAHWRALHPMPDPQTWAEIADPGERLRTGLRAVYGWYRETRVMTANVLRDAQSLPALDAVISSGLLRNLDRLTDILVAAFQARGRRAERIRLACRAAIDFEFWRRLESLGDDEAADLGASLVEAATAPQGRMLARGHRTRRGGLATGGEPRVVSRGPGSVGRSRR
jgi:AcrR family transcriptional regulator